MVNPEKSSFVPSQKVLYLGTVLDSRTFVASPSPDRIVRLLSLGEGFLSSVQQPAACWQSLLGTLSSLTHLVPGGRLRMRSLQFQLHQNWDRVEDSTLVPWTPACRLDLLRWLDEPRLQRGVSLAVDGRFGHGRFGLGHFRLGHFGQAFFRRWTFRP